MNKKLIIIGAFTSMLAVIIGAFGAHGLKAILSTPQLNTFEMAFAINFTIALLSW